MGVTSLMIEIANPAKPKVTEPVMFTIHSGAVYSVVPAKILRNLGIRSIKRETFYLTDGSKIIRRKGGALFKFGDKVGVADVIFGAKDDSVLLGALTLDALGLMPDALRRQVRPMRMILAVSSLS
jgi:hypothetical protein